MDTALGTCNSAVSHDCTIGDAHLPRKNHTVADAGATGNSHLGGKSTASACRDAMADLHQIVDLGSGTDSRLPHRRAIDGAATAHFNAVLENHRSGLWHLSPALGRGNESKPFGPHNGVGIDHTATTQSRTGMQHGVGMKFTTISHHHIVVNDHTGMHDAIGAEAAAGTDADPCSDRCAGPDNRPFIKHCCWMGLCQRPSTRIQPCEGFGKSQTWIGEDSESNATVLEAINQILLIR